MAYIKVAARRSLPAGIFLAVVIGFIFSFTRMIEPADRRIRVALYAAVGMGVVVFAIGFVIRWIGYVIGWAALLLWYRQAWADATVPGSDRLLAILYFLLSAAFVLSVPAALYVVGGWHLWQSALIAVPIYLLLGLIYWHDKLGEQAQAGGSDL